MCTNFNDFDDDFDEEGYMSECEEAVDKFGDDCYNKRLAFGFSMLNASEEPDGYDEIS
jgi:hypothetical protein